MDGLALDNQHRRSHRVQNYRGSLPGAHSPELIRGQNLIYNICKVVFPKNFGVGYRKFVGPTRQGAMVLNKVGVYAFVCSTYRVWSA